jgi:hypothetical protein
MERSFGATVSPSERIRDHIASPSGPKADQERPMNYPTRMLPLAIVVAAALQLSSVSIASAQQYLTGPGTQQRSRTMAPNIGPNGYYATQSTARAAHPITQGGTTGGTVNPGLTRDHLQHGYNG